MDMHCERDKAEEIEITPEMIEAGEEVLLEELGGGVICIWNPHDLARLVYLEMARRIVTKHNQ